MAGYGRHGSQWVKQLKRRSLKKIWRYHGGHGFESRWSPYFFFVSGFFFPIAEIGNLLRWSFFTFMYNRSSNMKCFIYPSHQAQHRFIITQGVISMLYYAINEIYSFLHSCRARMFYFMACCKWCGLWSSSNWPTQARILAICLLWCGVRLIASHTFGLLSGSSYPRLQSLRFFWSRGRRNGGLWYQQIPDVRKSRTPGNACVVFTRISICSCSETNKS